MNFSKVLKKIIAIALVTLFISSCRDSENKANQGPPGANINKIRVVMDNNYPPFIFMNSEGNQQGILVDQWKLWEKKTGVEVELKAMEWHEALAGMESGGYDVIDTIFLNEKRAQTYDFTKPYAEIDVPIFFNKMISGIKDADTAKGFSVAVKKGDNAINVLRQHGHENLMEFDSYEEIVKQAKANKVTVFVVDEPPAFYFLYKMGIQDEFKHTEPLYSGSFHRAVSKGNKEVLDLVNYGFSRISKSEYNKIDEKWYGAKSILKTDLIIYVFLAIAAFMLVTLILFIWNRTLKKQVHIKTMALEKEIELSAKKTEELSRSEELFRSTLESMDDQVFILDSENRFLSFHKPPKKTELLTSNETFLGKSIFELNLPEEAVSGYKSAVERLKKSGKPQSYEYSANILGENRWFSAKLSDRRSSSGYFDGATAVIRDITARRNLEIERERILSDLEIKNIELEKIIYIASHDLRSPLLNIHGFSKRLEKHLSEISEILSKKENMLKKGESVKEIIDDKAKNALSYITSSVSRMDGLINGLLRLSRSGSKAPIKIKLNVNEIINKTVASMHYQVEAAQAVIITENLPFCKGDHGQISQVFSNIIDNAIKYRDAKRQLQITIKGSEIDGLVTYAITDTGVGIAEENQKKVWEIFRRADNDSQIQGDGLGLAIAKRIIEKHGGKVDLESKTNQGSTFYITLEKA